MLFIQRARHLNIHAEAQITFALAADLLDALALNRKGCPRLRSLGNAVFHASLKRWHINLGAECSLRKCDRDFTIQIKVFSLENRVRTNADHQNHIARRAAVLSLIALPAHGKHHAVISSSRDCDGFLRAYALHAAAAAGIARIFDDFTRAVAGIAYMR